MDQIEQLSADRKKSFLSEDNKKSNGYRTVVGFLCIFPVVTLLAIAGDPAGVAVQESQVGKGSDSQDSWGGEWGYQMCVHVFFLEEW